MVKPSLLLCVLVATLSATQARADGAASFSLRPKFGAISLALPARAEWQEATDPGGNYLVRLSLAVDLGSVLRNIKSLSAKGLDRSKPCAEVVKVLDAKAKLTTSTSLSYDLRLHYAKRICAAGLPMDLPADVSCAASIDVSAAGSVIAFDIHGAKTPPCTIDGTSPGFMNSASSKIFKKHLVDLSDQLPTDFRGATINIRKVQFDTSPAPPRLQIVAESNMSPAQFKELMSAIKSPSRRASK
jgi:hypothetical protein